MKYQKGESGNPKGRPRGTSEAAKLRRAIHDDVPDIITAMVEAAKSGDTSAAKLLLDRAVPPLKQEAQAAPIDMKRDTLAERATAALDAAASGNLPPDVAAQLVQAVGTLARVVEVDELEQRITALEHEQDHETQN